MAQVGLTPEIVETWTGLVESKSFAKIQGAGAAHKKRVLMQLFENSAAEKGTYENAGAVRAAARKASKMLTEAPTTNTGAGVGPGLGAGTGTTGNAGDGSGLAGYDPIMIAMIRRSQPTLVAYDLVGVQPMTGPTGMVFALHAVAMNDDGTRGDELFALRNNGIGATAISTTPAEFASGIAGAGNAPILGGINAAHAKLTTAQGEVISSDPNAAIRWKRSTMTISRVNVVANTKALMAEFTDEVVQDMKALNGLDAEAELSNILSTEVAWEQNRELLDIIRYVAKPYNGGTVDIRIDSTATADGAAALSYKVAADVFGAVGFAERAKAVLFHIERASNDIARDTRRGKANWVLVSSDIATLLHLAQVLTVNPELKSNVELADDSSASLEVGTLIGGQKVIVDPYADFGSVVVGYKGKTALDSGFFWCPYVPLQKMSTRDTNTMQPKIAFKTRYGIGANPHAAGFLNASGVNSVGNSQGLTGGSNSYYRIFTVRY